MRSQRATARSRKSSWGSTQNRSPIDGVGHRVGDGRRRGALGQGPFDVVADDREASCCRRATAPLAGPVALGVISSVRTHPGHSTLTPMGTPATGACRGTGPRSGRRPRACWRRRTRRTRASARRSTRCSRCGRRRSRSARGRNARMPWTIAPEVHAHHPLPRRAAGRTRHRPSTTTPALLQTSVDRAEALDRGRGQRLHRRLAAHVGHHRQRVDAVRGDRARPRRRARRPRCRPAPRACPAWANRSASANPIPLAAPVTTATLPCLELHLALPPWSRRPPWPDPPAGYSADPHPTCPSSCPSSDAGDVEGGPGSPQWGSGEGFGGDAEVLLVGTGALVQLVDIEAGVGEGVAVAAPAAVAGVGRRGRPASAPRRRP